MRKQLRTLLLPAFFSVVIGMQPVTVFAQPTTDPENGIGNPDNPVPIDGGLLLLLSAGAGYGIKKYRDAKQNRTPNE